MKITINYSPSEEPIDVRAFRDMGFHYKTYDKLIDAGLIVATTTFNQYMQAVLQNPNESIEDLTKTYGDKIDRILLEYGNNLLDVANGRKNLSINELVEPPKKMIIQYFYNGDK